MRDGRTLRALRGATTADANAAPAILDATRELLEALARANGVAADDLLSATCTMTPDLDAAFPAAALRGLGWDVPAIGAVEAAVPGAPTHCIRVLLHAWLPDGATPRHAYLRGAAALRPDLTAG